MFTFFAVLLTNLLIATVFYLIVTLKLEKISTEYFSRKLRREMEEMINEFNITAERNISILEKRISQVKKLMEMSGSFDSVDLTVLSDETRDNARRVRSEIKNSVSDTAALITKSAVLHGAKSAKHHSGEKNHKLDIRSDAPLSISISDDDERISDFDLKAAIASAKDRNAMIAKLHKKGWSADEISRQCGIPMGELTLILNLCGNNEPLAKNN